ncbi:MAG TPA: ADP-ribosylglycohydrolase family protein [Puia sp.]|nr:ADP-ribosylglycohydrolase family protein [Puia sp.]
MNRDFIKDVLLGVAIGDAIGVPVEFRSREELQRNPITGVTGFGTHHQPPGTWSDDSSMTFCLAEMLCGEYDLTNLANRFINWKSHSYWTPHGSAFDIGITTRAAIGRLENGISPVQAGGKEESSNGNGSLMRILPLLFHIKDKNIEQRYELTKEVSSLTHRHIRSVIACFLYLEMALELINGSSKYDAYRHACRNCIDFMKDHDPADEKEYGVFTRILACNISDIREKDISSSGYVVHTLEASIWCFLNTRNYADAVLKAVNLGDDTDTTAAVTGGLAGLLYGYETIPLEWLEILARRADIEDLSRRLRNKLNKK